MVPPEQRKSDHKKANPKEQKMPRQKLESKVRKLDISDHDTNSVDDLPDRQKAVLNFIVKLTEEHGYPPTLAELATALGLRNRMTVHQHVAALKKKGFVHWEPGLNRSLKVVGPGLTLSNHALHSTGSLYEREDLTSRPVGIPMAGTIAAGRPIDALETPDYLKLDSQYGEAGCFALKVKGDSMIEDGIYDGDFVIIKPNPSPRNGEVVVALLGDGTATLKRFFKEKGQFRLQPANKEMEPMVYGANEDVTIQGSVVALFRKLS
jgi:repressor LexA